MTPLVNAPLVPGKAARARSAVVVRGLLDFIVRTTGYTLCSRVFDYSDKFAISFAASKCTILQMNAYCMGFIRASHSKRMIFIVHFLRAVVDGIIAQSRDCKS